MLLVFILFIIFLLMGMPVAFAIGIAGAVFFLQNPQLPFTMTIQLAISQTQNFPLLAIPLFIFAANLMNETGITFRLIKLAGVLAGHMRGGLAQVSVVLSTLMGGVSGSAIADAAMEARILGTEMIKKGFSKGYTTSVTTLTACITPIIPPSIGLILYGTIGEVSIGRLFAAGIIPGVMMMGFLMIVVSMTSKKKRYLPERERPSLKEVMMALIDSIWAYLFPFALIGGIRFGLFTPTEAGAFAGVYALAVGVLFYRELTWEKFKRTLEFTIIDIGSIMLIIALSGIFGYGLAYERAGDSFSRFMLGITNNPQILLLLIVGAVFIAGMFIDSTALILLFTAILLPLVSEVGVDPVHFGLVFMLVIVLGLVTPPVGVSMYTVCSILDCPLEEYTKESVPFILAIVLVDVILIFFPDLILFIPNLIFGKVY
ncbi:MAG: C4-dicarboxylate ABC transporter [Deltaproteobacteria bacterium RBG_19FT_COMBO_46_12]|nr:MAG: C4-dicarboxylate ABC transporter [Deltaproteobacteria bacterium RBG_19FT_COMBO_46_12]